MNKKIKQRPFNYRELKHPDLREDFEQDLINGFNLVSLGLTSTCPKTWTIEVWDNNVLIDEYIYNTASDYKNDVDLLTRKRDQS